MNPQCQYLVERRQNAVIGRIRGIVQAEGLTAAAEDRIMRKVVSEVEDFTGIALGLLDAVDDGVEFNELALEGLAHQWATVVARNGGIPG